MKNRGTGEILEYDAPEEARFWGWNSTEWYEFVQDRSDDFTTIQTSPNNGGCRFSIKNMENDVYITNPYVIVDFE